MDAKPKEIRIYETEEGHAPFSEWMDRQKAPVYGRVMARLERVELGNPGYHRGVGEGVYELKIDFGTGYRIYFGLDGNELVVLLIGGSKKTQQRDIKTAQQYWRKYNA